jgi:FAD-linked oxidoreductase
MAGTRCAVASRRVPNVRNWARNEHCRPTRVERPRTTDEVATIVRAAAASGAAVKCIGAGHSFTPTAMTDGVLVRLDRMDQVIDVDAANALVTVQAGITLRSLGGHLAGIGLAMPNLGDINVQTVAGAIATATHGTGREYGNLATTVVGMVIVDGEGRIVRCDVDHEPELLGAARVGIGALGIVTEATLQVVPAFNLHARERVEPLASVLADIGAFMSSADHAEFYFFPGDGRALTKRNERTDEAARPPSRLAYIRDKYVFENLAFGLACRTSRRFRTLAPRLVSTFADAAGERDLIDRSDRVFASPRHVRFVEMEYGVPLDVVAEAIERVEALVKSLHYPVLLPIEVRCSAADDIALSTGSGRQSGWIAVHQYVGMPYEDYFRGVEKIMDDYAGRPHWGKLHFQTASTLRDRYPAWDEFAAARDRLDRDRTYRNPYLDRVLG